jgi:signal transduction histidine kinase
VLAWLVAAGYAWLAWRITLVQSGFIVLPPAAGFPDRYRPVFQATHPRVLFWPITTGAAAALAGSAVLRRMPSVALGLLLAGSIAVACAFHAPPIGLLQLLPVDVALYFIAAHQPRRTTGTRLALAVVAVAGWSTLLLVPRFTHWFGGQSLNTPSSQFFSMEFIVTITTVVFWLVGTSSHRSRAFAESLAAQAATAERLRISRELHDSVAHSIGIIAVLAGAAGRVMQTQPTEAREALSSIETTSRDALTGLQRMLRTLRDADQDAATLEAIPGMADLDRLVAQAAGAGVRVEVCWRGRRRPLPPDIDQSAYRIIQEAVTNVVRHSGAEACRVDIGFERDVVAIEIVDEGRRGIGNISAAGVMTGTEGGFGLVGMRERVAMLSGDFSAGPLAAGGFRVAARLPA